jgi:large repetitive protein
MAIARGTVRDTLSSPVEGAEVELKSTYTTYVATTEADGTYEITNVFPTSGYQIEAGKILYFPDTKTGYDFSPGEEKTIDLTLTPYQPCTVFGLVKDVSGNILTGASIFINGEDVAYSDNFSTDAFGDYFVATLPPGNYQISASRSGYETGSVSGLTLQPGVPKRQDFTLVLDGNYGAVSGQVLDASGKPAYLVRVQSADGPSSRNIETQPDGRYLLPQLNAGTYRIYLSNENDSGSPEVTGVVVTAGNVTTGVDFNLNVFYGTISGTITDLTGTPIMGATIDTDSSGHSWYPANVQSGTAGQYLVGRLKTDGESPKAYTLNVSKEKYASVYYQKAYVFSQADLITLVPGESVTGIDVALPPGAEISGGVVDDKTGLPLTSGTIYARMTVDGSIVRTFSDGLDAQGKYQFDTLPPGSYELYTSISGYPRMYWEDTYYEVDETLIGLVTGELKQGYDFSIKPGATIAGWVRDESGVPYNSGSVRAYDFRRSPEDYWDTSISSGQYTLSNIPQGTYYVYANVSGKPPVFFRQAYTEVQAATVSMPAGLTRQNIDITIPASIENGSIAGTIYKNDGTPYTGVSVRLYGVDGSSGSQSSSANSSDGTYSFGNLLPGAYVVGLVETDAAPYYYGGTYNQAAATRLYVDPGEDVTGIDVTAPVRNDGSVTGTVVDASDQPVGGVEVDLSWAWSNYSTITADDGSFIFPQVFPHDEYTLEAEKNGYQPSETTLGVNAGQAVTGVKIILTSFNPGAIAGTVTDVSGNTLYSVYTQISRDGSSFSATMNTNPSGQFMFDQLQPGSYTIYNSRSGFQQKYTYSVVVSGGNTTTRDIQMVRSGTFGLISGTVNDASGNPVNNVYVRTEPGNYITYTRVDGTYQINGVNSNTYRVYLPNETGTPEVTGVVVEDGKETAGVDFQLAEAYGTMSGTVLDGNTLEPVFGLNVRAGLYEGGFNSSTFNTDLDGEFTISKLPLDAPGGFRVWCYGNEYVYTYHPDRVVYAQAVPVFYGADSSIEDIDFLMYPGAVVRGRVTDESMNPLSSGNVRYYYLYDDTSNSWSDNLDDGGMYEIGNLPGGDYKILATASGYLNEYFDEKDSFNDADIISIATGTEYFQDFSLTKAAGFTGIVTDSGGNPIENARVFVKDYPAGSSRSNYSDAAGRYSITGLVAGDYILYVQTDEYLKEYHDDAYQEEQATVETVATGEERTIDFQLELGGKITGRLRDLGGNPITSGSMYAYRQPENTSIYTSVDSSGDYEFTGLFGGQYKVRATSSGYVAEYFDNALSSNEADLITVVTGSVTPDINFLLLRGGTVTGTVQNDSGAPYGSGTVRLYSTTDLVNSLYSGGLDSSGEFTISSIYPGSYYASVDISGKPRLFYQNVYAASEATEITVAENSTVSGILFTVPETIENGSISGRVTLDGSSFYGRVYRRGVDGYSGSWSVLTDSDTGMFEFSNVQPGTWVFYVIRDNRPDYYYGGTEDESAATRIVLLPGQDLTDIHIALPVAQPNFALVSGKILDAVGNPVGGAQVQLSGQNNTYTVVSAPDGTYQFAEVLPGDTYDLLVEKEGYFPESLGGLAVEDYDLLLDQDFVLTGFTGGILSGMVRNASGAPIANVSITVDGTSLNYSTSISNQYSGAYSIGNLPPGDYEVKFSSSGYGAVVESDVSIAAGLTTIVDATLTFQSGRGIISGLVLDASDNPAYGVFVRTSGGTYSTAYTNQLGQFYLANLSAGSGYRAYCSSESGAPGVDNITVVADQVLDAGTIRLQELYAWITGTVTNATGEAVMGAAVRHEGGSFGSNTVYTDHEGEYLIHRVRTDGGPSYRVKAEKLPYATTYYVSALTVNDASLVALAPGQPFASDIDIVLGDGASISGQVLSSAGNPVVGCSIRIEPENSEYSTKTYTTDNGGRYYAEGLVPGSYKVRAEINGLVTEYYDNQVSPASASLVVLTAGRMRTGIDFRLDSGGAVEGTIVDSQGAPIDSAWVYVDNAQSTAGSGSDQTDGDGRYRVEGLPTDVYRVRAQKTGYNSSYQYNVSVISDQAVTVDMVLYQQGESTPTPTPTVPIGPTLTPTPTVPIGPTPTYRPGDFYRDGQIDAYDLIRMIEAFRNDTDDTDMDGSSEVDYKDLFEFSAYWKSLAQ